MSKAKKTGSKDAERKAKAPVNAGEKSLTIEGVTVPVSHLDKVYYPGEGITKGDVIQYYLSMADYLMKYLKGRPLSLFRNPGGIGEPGFFQKDVDGNLPSFAASYEMEAASTGKIVHYFVCNNLASLVYLNNLGCIEINPWHSTVNSPDRPDYLIIDIDPSVNNTFEQVMETALTIREVLDHAGAPSYCKTSGATGMHIYVPASGKYLYDELKDFAHEVCLRVNGRLSATTTLQRSLSKRDRSQIYLDYLQNSRSQTIASVYSLRPRPGATVSTPLDWKEVRKGLTPGEFTIQNTLQRVRRQGDFFNNVLGKGIDLKKCVRALPAQ